MPCQTCGSLIRAGACPHCGGETGLKRLAAVTLLTFALYAAWTAFMVEVRIRLRKRLAKLDNAKAAYLVDSLSGTEVVKLMGTQAAELSPHVGITVCYHLMKQYGQINSFVGWTR